MVCVISALREAKVLIGSGRGKAKIGGARVNRHAKRQRGDCRGLAVELT
jgi:hypothetical protein